MWFLFISKFYLYYFLLYIDKNLVNKNTDIEDGEYCEDDELEEVVIINKGTFVPSK